MLKAAAADTKGGNGEAVEEMVFSVQGVVCAIELPPLMEKPS